MDATQPLQPRSLAAARTKKWLLFCALSAVSPASLLVTTRVHAQQTYAQIKGTVTAEETGKPLAGVTVVVQGPALQAEQAEVTDAAGNFLITQLPPGDDYVVNFYFGADEKPRVVRPGIRLSLGKTITINAPIRMTGGKREVKIIREAAPNVDTASASTGVEVNQEVLRNTPVRGRTFESVMTLAPGTADVAGKTGGAGGDVGVQISGSTGNENNFIIDGLNTSDPNKGLVGTELSQYFLREVQVLTGGYPAEYGRATGGVVNITIKSGGNEFHGSVFGSVQPYQIDPKGIARLGEALVTRTKTNLLYDFGFELGGYLWKDRIWFFIGMAPTFEDYAYNRRARTLTFDPNSRVAPFGMKDPNFSCPTYLSSEGLCDGPRDFSLQTTEIGEGLNFGGNKRIYNGVAKLQFNFNADHNVSLTYFGSPTTYDDYSAYRAVNLESQRYTQTDQIHDAIFHYIGKVLDRKLQFDVLYGYHYQASSIVPTQIDRPSIAYARPQSNPFSLYDFEDVEECKRSRMMNSAGAMVNFNPCPLTGYTDGYGGYTIESLLQRHQLIASATYFLNMTQKWNPFRGTHAFKLGFEFEQVDSYNNRSITGPDDPTIDPVSGVTRSPSAAQGHRSYSQAPDGTIQVIRQYGQQAVDANGNLIRDANGNPIFEYMNNFAAPSFSRNYALYLRDSWNVGWLPGLVLNVGFRWEGQELYGRNKTNTGFQQALAILDNWAPRVGLTYDFTQLTSRPGRSKIFFNYGRFYQSIPLNINDRQFTREGLYSSGFSETCANRQLRDMNQSVPNVLDPGCQFFGSADEAINGGRYPLLAPGLKGQYINEIVLGLQYDLGYDIVVGAQYIHRDLGNIIEDLSPDGGATYIIANPGVQADPEQIRKLEGNITDLRNRSNGAGLTAAEKEGLQADLADAEATLSAYKLVGNVFPKARRNYDALVLTLNKRLSNRFSVISSYTYSRTLGNYPGTFSASNGQNDPNISSQFDLIDLLANRNGPLPTDRPHNFKLTGFYEQPVAGDKGKLTIGLTFTANSGRPIEVLGRHPLYGRREVYILPRGAGGRTPVVTQFDLHIGYEHKLAKSVALSVFGDVVNLFNQQEVTNVDDEYTNSVVSAITNGKLSDLSHLKQNNGTFVTFNSNYGQPTAYQRPLYLRFGGRITF